MESEFKVGDKVYHIHLERGEVIKIKSGMVFAYFGGDVYDWFDENELELINE